MGWEGVMGLRRRFGGRGVEQSFTHLVAIFTVEFF
jgi:hypothetical protein